MGVGDSERVVVLVEGGVNEKVDSEDEIGEPLASIVRPCRCVELGDGANDAGTIVFDMEL